ncbi:MAG TPA: class I SAM-dependent methyltransferase [Methylophilaceae bacterium]|nr:class I SAM-dependent methyltransferase [Methylophilaceae bacterium]
MDKTLQKYPSVQRLARDLAGNDVKPGIFTSVVRIVKNYVSNTALAPATLSVLIQCAALLAVLASSWAIYLAAAVYFNTDLGFPIFVLVLMQALIAASFAHMSGMDSWWRWIHLGFPIAIWAMSTWHIPSEFYLLGFIISLSLFWTTFRSQVPFFPSRPVTWQQLARLMPADKQLSMIDIGSGLGDMSMHIAKARPNSRVEGIEIAPLPWVISYVRAFMRRSSAAFKLGDYRELDFANYDVIFAYLSPAAMLALWQKASAEMQPGSMLVSLEFEIPGITPSQCIAAEKNAPAMYVWHIA